MFFHLQWLLLFFDPAHLAVFLAAHVLVGIELLGASVRFKALLEAP
jgi:hypothetical protein